MNATTFDPATAVGLTNLVDSTTGSLTWTPPSDGNWTIFDMLGQSTLRNTSGVALPNSPVINHLSKEAIDLYLSTFTAAFESDPELKEMYKKVGGYFFGDSLELTGCVGWTPTMLEEFKARRGYDLTPYLPAVLGQSGTGDATAAGAFTFGNIGMSVRLDFAETCGDLFAENHIGRIGEWAREELGMGVRYQAYGSDGAVYADVSKRFLAADIPETESQGRGGSLDFHRTGAA
ncbi:MAG: hypothetical protein FWH55_12190, partial [Oscillospiraceae bacterium]|nr:hypothetical protein [Oscillospiraceae bacterium]